MEGVPDDVRAEMKDRVLDLLVIAVTERMKKGATRSDGKLAQLIELFPRQDSRALWPRHTRGMEP